MKRLRTLLCATVCLAAFGAAAQYTPPPVDEENPRYLLMEEADSAIVRGDYQNAAARLLDALTVCPDCPDNALLLSNLGMVYAYDGRDSLALAALDRALELAPKLRTAHSNRARILLTQGRDAEAKLAFTRVLELDSLNMDARYYRGMLALYSGDLDTAEGDLAVLRDSLPNESATARAHVALYTLTGRNSEAVPYFQRLIRQEPAPEYYAGLASCYLSENQLSEASATIGEAMEKYPDDGEIYYCRAWLNKLLFRPSEAKADGRKAQELGVPKARVQRLLKQ